MKTVPALLVIVVVASAAIAQETPPTPQETIEGDGQAWQEVKSAYERLTKLKSYRAFHRGLLPSMVEVINPDRFHFLLGAGPIGIEFVLAESQYAERNTTRSGWTPWRCFPARQNFEQVRASLPPLLLLTMTKHRRIEKVKIARLGEVRIERDITQGFEYSLIVADDQPIWERLFAISGLGLPRRTEVLDADGTVRRRQSVDYRDFDAPISITPPRC